jgi:hypothetical protein
VLLAAILAHFKGRTNLQFTTQVDKAAKVNGKHPNDLQEGTE